MSSTREIGGAEKVNKDLMDQLGLVEGSTTVLERTLGLPTPDRSGVPASAGIPGQHPILRISVAEPDWPG